MPIPPYRCPALVAPPAGATRGGETLSADQGRILRCPWGRRPPRASADQLFAITWNATLGQRWRDAVSACPRRSVKGCHLADQPRTAIVSGASLVRRPLPRLGASTRHHTAYFTDLPRRVLSSDVTVDLAQPWRRPVYGDPRLTPQRLGQQAFQAVVLDAHRRRCAITGDRIRPVLQAAHIKVK